MTAVQANWISIEYQEFGPPDAPTIVLIMGLGMQLLAWPDSFCEGLAARGFRVVRYDNRDIGLSSRMPSAGRLATTGMLARGFRRLPVRPPYTLNDMAREASRTAVSRSTSRSIIARWTGSPAWRRSASLTISRPRPNMTTWRRESFRPTPSRPTRSRLPAPRSAIASARAGGRLRRCPRSPGR